MSTFTDTAVPLLRAETPEPLVIETAAGTVIAFGSRRPGAERPSEDSALVMPLPHGVLLAVADGAGGHALGGEASQEAIGALTDRLQRADHVDDMITGEAFASASAAVRRLGPEAITTLIVALITEGTVCTWHTGDSTALLTGQRGRVKLRTIDHTPPGLRAGAGEISFDDVHADHERHLLVAALGIDPLQVEHNGPVRIAPRDTLVMASDGLFDNLLDQEIVDTVRTGPLFEGLTDLVLASRLRMRRLDGDRSGKPDDLCVLTFRPRV